MRQWLDTGVKPASCATPASWPAASQGDLTCNGTWRYYGAPRHVAGAPLTLDVVKCRLKPLARGDYGVDASPTRSGRSCRPRSRPASATTRSPASSQQPPKARWLTFADGPRRAGARPGAGGGGVRDGHGRRDRPADALADARPPASFGAFTPGVADTYDASTTAERDLDRGRRGADGVRARPPGERRVHAAAAAAGGDPSKSTWTAPVSNDAVAITFRRRSAPTDALRTGTTPHADVHALDYESLRSSCWR